MLKANEALGLSNRADVNLYECNRELFNHFFEKIENKIKDRCQFGFRNVHIDSWMIYDDPFIARMLSPVRLHIAQVIIKELINNGYQVSYSDTSAEFTIRW